MILYRGKYVKQQHCQIVGLTVLEQSNIQCTTIEDL